jgi:hypothetical protein
MLNITIYFDAQRNSAMDHINVDILSNCIMPYVGTHQFRFVAGVNRSLYQAYTTFTAKKIQQNPPKSSGCAFLINTDHKWTYYDVSTTQHAKICYEETTHPERYTLCALAAKDGNLPVLEYLKTVLDCPWNVRTCAMAGRYGHVPILEYARQNGCDWNDSTLIYAAQNGHLSILEWAFQNGYTSESISIYVSSNAAECGQLHILQWLHEKNCSFHDDVTRYAADRGHPSIVQWLCARGY